MKIPELTPEEAVKRLGERIKWAIGAANRIYDDELKRIENQKAAAKSKRDNAIKKLQAECAHKDQGEGFCIYCGAGDI